jgi:hypothetical protein
MSRGSQILQADEELLSLEHKFADMYAKIIDMGNIDAAPKSKLHFPKS